MKTLLLYASKSGGTRTCAERIRDRLDSLELDLVDVHQNKKIDWTLYDTVIFGTSLYMGKADRKIKKILSQHEAILLQKDLHFFICGLARGQHGIDLFRKNVESPLLDQARQIRQVGCEIYLARLNFFYRSIIKKIIEDKEPELGFDEEELEKFIDTLGAST